MELGPRIAIGRTAEVYACSGDRIVKLFLPEWSHLARVELELVKRAAELELPVPGFHGSLEIRGRTGLLFERVRGPSLSARMQARPWTIRRFTRSFANLHAQLHSAHALDLPAQHEWIEERIRMAPAPPELKATALRELSALPEGDRVCHGDFHPGNVLVSGSRFVVIDWTNATSGHPVGDIALSCLLLLHAEPLAGPTRSRLLGLGRAWVERAYLSEYSRVRTIDPVQLTRWIPILAVARLSENIVGERQILIELAREVFAAAA